MGKQALLSLKKVVQERKPHSACAAAQNNWDHCAGGTRGAELGPASSWGWQELGQELGEAVMFSVKAVSALVPSCSLAVSDLCWHCSSTGIHEGSSLASTGCLGGSFREDISHFISGSSELGKNFPNQDLLIFSTKFDLNELLCSGG